MVVEECGNRNAWIRCLESGVIILRIFLFNEVFES